MYMISSIGVLLSFKLSHLIATLNGCGSGRKQKIVCMRQLKNFMALVNKKTLSLKEN